MRDLMLKAVVSAQTKLTSERGSEIVSVGLIMGLVAIVVILIFTGGTGGDGGLMGALRSLGDKVKAILNGVTNTAT